MDPWNTFWMTQTHRRRWEEKIHWAPDDLSKTGSITCAMYVHHKYIYLTTQVVPFNKKLWNGKLQDEEFYHSSRREARRMISRIVNSVLDFFRSLFWKQEMELTLVGLQNSGKTTLVNVIAVSSPPSCFSLPRDDVRTLFAHYGDPLDFFFSQDNLQKVPFPQWASTWRKWPKEMWPSSFGILAVNPVSAVCGKDIVEVSMPLCRSQIIIRASSLQLLTSLFFPWFSSILFGSLPSYISVPYALFLTIMEVTVFIQMLELTLYGSLFACNRILFGFPSVILCTANGITVFSGVGLPLIFQFYHFSDDCLELIKKFSMI